MAGAVAVVVQQLRELATADAGFAVPMVHLVRVIQGALTAGGLQRGQQGLGEPSDGEEEQQQGKGGVLGKGQGMQEADGAVKSRQQQQQQRGQLCQQRQEEEEVVELCDGLLQQLVLVLGPERAQQLQQVVGEQLGGTLYTAARYAGISRNSRSSRPTGGPLLGSRLMHPHLQLQQCIPPAVRLWYLLHQTPAEQMVMVWGNNITSALQGVAAAVRVRPHHTASPAAAAAGTDSDSDNDDSYDGGIDISRRWEAAWIGGREGGASTSKETHVGHFESESPWAGLSIIRLPWIGRATGNGYESVSSLNSQHQGGSCRGGNNSVGGSSSRKLGSSCSCWPCGFKAAVEAAAEEDRLLVVVINHWGAAAATQIGELMVMAAEQWKIQQEARRKKAATHRQNSSGVNRPMTRSYESSDALISGAAGGLGFRLVVVVPYKWLQQVWWATGCMLLPCCQEMEMESLRPQQPLSSSISKKIGYSSSISSSDMSNSTGMRNIAASVLDIPVIKLYPSGLKVAWLLSLMLQQQGPWPSHHLSADWSALQPSGQRQQLQPLTMSIEVLQPLALAAATAWMEGFSAGGTLGKVSGGGGGGMGGIGANGGRGTSEGSAFCLPGPFDIQHMQLLLQQVVRTSSAGGQTSQQQRQQQQVVGFYLDLKQLQQLLHWVVLHPGCCSGAQQQCSLHALSRCLSTEWLGLKPKAIAGAPGAVAVRQEVVADLEDELKQLQQLLQQRQQQGLQGQGGGAATAAVRAEQCWLMLQDMAAAMGWVGLGERSAVGLGGAGTLIGFDRPGPANGKCGEKAGML